MDSIFKDCWSKNEIKHLYYFDNSNLERCKLSICSDSYSLYLSDNPESFFKYRLKTNHKIIIILKPV